MSADLRTYGIVLRRTNYGESDRIVNFVTPEGKISALAKSSRKEKSRLAGGIELFTLADITIHQSKTFGMGILTSAKMLKFYGGILQDFDRLELASKFLKWINKHTENREGDEYFNLLKQGLNGLNKGLDLELVQSWFVLNLARINGEEINLVQDTDERPLDPQLLYQWDNIESALRPSLHGKIDAKAIKLTRLILASPLLLIAQIDQAEMIAQALQPIIQAYRDR